MSPQTKQKAKSAAEKPAKSKTTAKKTDAKKPSSMEDLMKSFSFQAPKKSQIISAEIIEIDKKHILFDIGWKSYAVLGDLETKELTTYLPYLNVGDKIDVKVVVEEAKEGYPVVSMRKFFEKGKWDILLAKQRDEEEVEVLCGSYGKGGVFVDFMGIRGVIPKIQLTEEYIDSAEKLMGQKIKVKVLEVDREKNRLVVSQKAAALGISYKDLKKSFDSIKVDKKYKATVIGFSSFGVFCEVDKIEGLIHISEISWQKVTDPHKFVKVGDVVDVVVVEKNEDNFKLNLSIKRLTPDPWEQIEKTYPPDRQVEGEVIRKERYGYIVRLEEGIEGLVHISKLSGREDLKLGDKVKVYVEKIDKQNRRMSLVFVAAEKPVMYR